MAYVLHRLALLPPTLLLVAAAVFVMVRVVPGDVVTLLVNDQNVTESQADELRTELGLDKPLPVQFLEYLAKLLRGDFGKSIWTDQGVFGEIVDRLPITAELAFLAILFSLCIGVPIGILSALYQDRWPDYTLRAIAIAGLSIPGFWLGTLAVVMPAIWWGYSPPLRYVSPLDDPVTNLRQFAVPAFIMSLFLSSILMRMTRSAMLEVLRQDFVRTARAKGLSEGIVIARHALRNAMIPIVTIVGTQMAVLIGGTVIFEHIFNLRGIGSYVFQAVTQRDYPAIQAVNVLLAMAVLMINLVVDLSYAYLDPRLRSS
jgi:peptide/nickel transport system permease protein